MSQDMRNVNGDRGHEWGEGGELSPRAQRILVWCLLLGGLAVLLTLCVMAGAMRSPIALQLGLDGLFLLLAANMVGLARE